MDELKWCEQCDEWLHATPRRCPRCSAKWAEMVTQGRRMHERGAAWPQTPPEAEGAPGGVQDVVAPNDEEPTREQ